MIKTENISFFLGVVEDRNDPLKLGRARVRVLGLHTHDKTLLPTEDLPWAYKIQPTTSGAMSGIGHSPIGVVEGTWVAVQYIDPEKQMPFIVGTLGGIPQEKYPDLQTFRVVATNSGAVSVQEEQAQQQQEEVAAQEPQEVQDSFVVRSPKEFTTSETAISFIKSKEGFKASPYRDSGGIWTIGYGTTSINGVPVTQSTPAITEQQAETFLRTRIKADFESSVKRNVRAPITQSMFDACVSFAYNVGSTGFARSLITSNLNSGRYEDAAAAFTSYTKDSSGNTLRGLVTRREDEKNLFLRDGVPTTNGTVQETPQSIQQQEIVAADPANQNAQTINFARERIGFFDPNVGFKDPNGKYPLQTHLVEPDTNRLARNEKIRETIVYAKELAEHKGVEKANGKGTWDQSPTPYNAKYPFNNVWQSESGHFMEFDDTQGRERVHLYHKSGSFTEIDHNGSQVTRVVGDGYEIYERNGFIHVVGDRHVKVDGAKTLLIENTLDVEVHGAATINLHGNAKLNVAANLDITAGGTVKIKSGGTFAVDAPRIDLNGGVASGLSTIGTKSPNTTQLGPLQVLTRKDEIASNYESPDEGESNFATNTLVQEGVISADELKTPPQIEENKEVEENNVEETPVEETFAGNKNFNYTELFSKYYTLGDLTDGGSRKLVAQSGLTEDAIYNNLKALAVNVLDRIKQQYPNVRINSGLRLGTSASQHNKGQAVDISFPGLTRAQLYDRILEIQRIIPYDQLLLEYITPGGNGWIHISYSSSNNRRQVFTMNNHKRVSSIGTFAKVT